MLAVVAAAAGVALVAHGKPNTSGSARARNAGAAGSKRLLPAAVHLISAMPPRGSAPVVGTTTIALTFSVPMADTTAFPVITPKVAGQWQTEGTSLVFAPAMPLPPHTRFTVRVPAGASGIRSAAGGTLAKPFTVRLRTAGYSPLRLAQDLSLLGYLPLSWAPLAPRRMTGGPVVGTGLAAQEAMAYSPPAGEFTWHAGYPATLRAQWHASYADPVIRGAVMAFQSQHGMSIDGAVTAAFWRKLFVAVDRGDRNGSGYTYAIASKGSPETLTIWHNGKVVLRTLANTGIPVAPTASGTYPVYLRFRFQIMRGTNPDGSHYADPVSFVSYFDGGEAVHYFPRGAYGFPQSLGCVELPYKAAEQAWPYLTYGSLVTVTS